MNKKELFELMNANPAMHLATTDGDQARVRGMLLYRADADGIIFHTAASKDLYLQIMKNPKAEICFQTGETQIRVTGVLEEVTDDALKEEIFNHPSRAFLRAWKEQGIEDMLRIFRMKNGSAVTWTMTDNFAPKKYIEL